MKPRLYVTVPGPGPRGLYQAPWLRGRQWHRGGHLWRRSNNVWGEIRNNGEWSMSSNWWRMFYQLSGIIQILLSSLSFYFLGLCIPSDYKTRLSESDGRSNVTDCLDLRLVFIALIGLYFSDWPDWFRLPWLICISLIFKASALWADAFYKSKCPYICVSVCLCVCRSVHFWGTV